LSSAGVFSHRSQNRTLEFVEVFGFVSSFSLIKQLPRSGFVFAPFRYSRGAIRGPSPSLRTTARDARSGLFLHFSIRKAPVPIMREARQLFVTALPLSVYRLGKTMETPTL
jgi:hypothetical protein